MKEEINCPVCEKGRIVDDKTMKDVYKCNKCGVIYDLEKTISESLTTRTNLKG